LNSLVHWPSLTKKKPMQSLVSPRLASLAFALTLALVGCDDPKSQTAATPSATTQTASSAGASSASSAAASASAAPSAAVAVAVPSGPPASFELDPSHSRVTFSVRHMMVSNTRGQFGKFTGQVFLDEANPAASNVTVDIDTTTIDTTDPKRDEHLRSPEFFDVKKFPKMTFKSTEVSRAGQGYKVVGNLTIKDVTKPVTLTVDSIVKETKDPWGMVRRGTHASAKIDRKEFGLTWNKALETGGVAVGDEVTLDLEIELIKKDPNAKPAEKK